MTPSKFTSVDDYLQSLDATKATTLRQLIASILAQFPELAAKIAWNVPQLHRRGEYVVGVCAYKHHLTFSAWSGQVIADFGPRLAAYKVFKNCFQIPVDWDIDHGLVHDLVRARLRELDGVEGGAVR